MTKPTHMTPLERALIRCDRAFDACAPEPGESARRVPTYEMLTRPDGDSYRRKQIARLSEMSPLALELSRACALLSKRISEYQADVDAHSPKSKDTP